MRTKGFLILIAITLFVCSAAETQTPPSKFDLRDVNGVNYVTSIKSQSGGTCWTHSAMAAMEGNLLITGNWTAAGEIGEPNLAEYHLDWWNGFNKHNNDDRTPPTGAGLTVHEGGDFLVSAAYLGRNEGAVRDIDGQSYSSPPLRSDPGYHYYYPRNIEWYVAGPNLINIDTIKEKIMAHGVLGVCMCSSSSFMQGIIHYQPPTSTFDPNHAVAVVGWDDDKVTQAPNKGAWLVKNSWGSAWGANGYFWISYYDKHCCQNKTMGAISYQDVEIQQYDNFYYHDYHGWRDTKTDADEAFNAFVSKSNPGKGMEVIKAVSFYTAEDNVSYTFKIYDDFTGSQLSGELASQTGSFDHTGFHTVDLTGPVPLGVSEDFYVYLSLSKGGQPYDRTSDVPVLLGSSARVIVESTSNPQESYYLDNTTWKDFYYDDNTANFCIKAITVETSELLFDFPAGLPYGQYPPGPETELNFNINPGVGTYLAGSAKLYYRFDSASSYSVVAASELGGNQFQAILPNTAPGDEPQFYFAAESTGGKTAYSPYVAPSEVYSFDVAFVEEVFKDDFETHQGWTIDNINLTDGPWERGVPAGGGARGDPPTDYDGSGNCYVTDNVAGDSDVDGGPTILTSPVIDLSAGDAEISYWRWHNNDDNDDPFTVEVSNDNGVSWTQVEQVLNTIGWNNHSFDLSSFVTPTAHVKVRFSSIDQPNDSVTESGVDAFFVRRIVKDASLWGDAYTLSTATGSLIRYNLDAGTANAGRQYLIMGTLSGTSPGFTLPGGMVMPINWDLFTTFMLTSLSNPVFQDFIGVLDGAGCATAELNTFGPINPLVVGMDINFAFTLRPPAGWDFTSNTIKLHFEK